MAVSGKKKSRKSPAPGGKVSGKTVSAGNGSGVRPRLKDDISAIVSIALGAFLIFALFVAAAGKVGAGISALLKGCFGAIAFILPFALIAYGIRLFARQRERRGWRSAVLVGLIFFMALLLESAFFLNADSVLPGSADFTEIFRLSADGKSGGVVGMYAGAFLTNFIGKAGLCIFSVVVLLVSALLLFNTPLSPYFHTLRERRIDAKARKAAERESAEAVRENEAEDLDPRAPDGSDTRDGAPDGRKTKSSVFSRKLSRNQINILDAVKNDDLHVTGSETAPQTAADAGSATEPVPETDAVSETEDAAGTGFGLEPPFRGGPGLGLDGGDEQAWAPVYQFRSGGNSGWADEDGDPAASAAPEGADAVRADPRGNATDALIAGKAEPVSAIGFGAGDAKDRFLPSPALGHYTFPPVDLLNRGPKIIRTENAQELKFKARKLEQTLRDFKVDATVIRVTVGPTVTRYEVKPDVGVKIQSIKSLEPDLALKLEVKSVRVVPMPGQAVIGIEAYNANTNLVTLREIIDSPEFRSEASKIAFVLGKNISGERIIADLNDMPHLLIAGTTGSGKSVCINSILLSILYHAGPDEVKLILIDPKVVELKSYNDIPHLLVPVVTDPEQAATALNYAVTLMNERYRKFAEYNVRNLDGYNARLKKDGLADDILPRIVIVIDELSDLMMIAPAKVQESISRLAAMARAAGMHLIVATQQPLASILTSVIKANIPSRIAFSVSSNSASRVILDEAGAERLHGNGDMLFSPVGTREPMRIQGSFVSDSEVHKVTDYIKKKMDPAYSPDVLQAVRGELSGQLVDEGDELFRDAVEMVVPAKQASVSMIQRRFRIGYNRAARLVDMMEERGIVAASDGMNKPRKVLMNETQLADFLGAGASVPGDPPPFDAGDGDA